jgi:hypothetical protein
VASTASMSTRAFTLIINEMFRQALKLWDKSGYGLDSGSATTIMY